MALALVDWYDLQKSVKSIAGLVCCWLIDWLIVWMTPCMTWMDAWPKQWVSLTCRFTACLRLMRSGLLTASLAGCLGGMILSTSFILLSLASPKFMVPQHLEVWEMIITIQPKNGDSDMAVERWWNRFHREPLAFCAEVRVFLLGSPVCLIAAGSICTTFNFTVAGSILLAIAIILFMLLFFGFLDSTTEVWNSLKVACQFDMIQPPLIGEHRCQL